MQEPLSASPAKKFGSASLRRSQIERQHVRTYWKKHDFSFPIGQFNSYCYALAPRVVEKWCKNIEILVPCDFNVQNVCIRHDMSWVWIWVMGYIIYGYCGCFLIVWPTRASIKGIKIHQRDKETKCYSFFRFTGFFLSLILFLIMVGSYFFGFA